VATDVSNRAVQPRRHAHARAPPRRERRCAGAGPRRGNRPPLRLGDSVGDWILSPDGKRVAFGVKSAVVKTGATSGSRRCCPTGSRCAWSPGPGPSHFPRRHAPRRIEREKASSIGNLVVGPASGGTGRTIAQRGGGFLLRSRRQGGRRARQLRRAAEVGSPHLRPPPRRRAGRARQAVTTWVWSPDKQAPRLQTCGVPAAALGGPLALPRGQARRVGGDGQRLRLRLRPRWIAVLPLGVQSARRGPAPWRRLESHHPPTASPGRSSRASSASAPARRGTGCSSPTRAPTRRPTTSQS
jgi:hypothetical protein